MKPSFACSVWYWLIVRNRNEIGFGPACDHRFDGRSNRAMLTYKSTAASMFLKPTCPLEEIDADPGAAAGRIITMLEGLAE